MCDKGKPCQENSRTKETRLSEILFALEEPWRERFLILVAQLATDWRWRKQAIPNRSEVTVWLENNSALQHTVSWLLRAWTGKDSIWNFEEEVRSECSVKV